MSASRRTGRVAALGLALCLHANAACSADDAEAIDWQLRISDASLVPSVTLVEAVVLRGGCNAQEVLYRAEIGPDARGPAPSALAPGRYGLSASARDAECRTLARGCLEVSLPVSMRGAVYEVVLSPVDEGPACAADVCRSGRCDSAGAVDRDAAAVGDPLDAAWPPERRDAAMPDAGPGDAGARDAGARDAGLHDVGPRDASVSDAGVPPPDAAELDAGPPPPPPPPPDPCRLDRCYDVSTVMGTFDDAQAVCRGRGGALVSFDDSDEEAFVLGLTGDASFWIGMSDAVTEGTWVWDDGSTATYRSWAAGEPDDAHEGEDCAMFSVERAGWTSERCRFRKPYVCESTR